MTLGATNLLHVLPWGMSILQFTITYKLEKLLIFNLLCLTSFSHSDLSHTHKVSSFSYAAPHHIQFGVCC